MRIVRRIIQPRAFILLAILVLALGGCTHDEQAQGGTARQGTQPIYTEREVRNGENIYTATPGAGTSRTRSITAAGTDPEANRSRFSQPGNNAEITEDNSPTQLSSRGSSGRSNRLSSDLFNSLGQEFKITAYKAGYESTGKNPGDEGYGETYSGAMVKENHTIAADLRVLPLGTKVVIEGIGAVFTVEDKGDAVKGKHIDLYNVPTTRRESLGRTIPENHHTGNGG